MRLWPAGLDRTVLTRWPMVALMVANVLPLVGVVVLGWELGLVMLLFWAENGVVGFYSIVKMAWAAKWGAIVLAPFFVIHFGGFMAGHLLFLLLFFVLDDPFEASWTEIPSAVGLDAPFVWLALAALFLSHGFSFFRNFVDGPERHVANPLNLMGAPYKRVVVLHLVIIFGGMLVLALGQPVAALAVLVLLKTGVDLLSHAHEHRKAYRRSENPT